MKKINILSIAAVGAFLAVVGLLNSELLVAYLEYVSIDELYKWVGFGFIILGFVHLVILFYLEDGNICWKFVWPYVLIILGFVLSFIGDKLVVL